MCGLFVYLLIYVLTYLFIYLSTNVIFSSKVQNKYSPKLSTNKTSSEQLLLLSDNVDYKKNHSLVEYEQQNVLHRRKMEESKWC